MLFRDKGVLVVVVFCCRESQSLSLSLCFVLLLLLVVVNRFNRPQI